MNKLIILLIFNTLLTSCGSPDICKKHYAFDFPMTVTPQDTFSIGDTIWYEMNLPNQLLDKNSGEYIDLTSYDGLSFTFNISKIDTNFVYGAMQLFDIYVKNGRLEQDINYFTYTYLHFEETNIKHLKFAVIPKRTGCYSSALSLNIEYLSERIRLSR